MDSHKNKQHLAVWNVITKHWIWVKYSLWWGFPLILQAIYLPVSHLSLLVFLLLCSYSLSGSSSARSCCSLICQNLLIVKQLKLSLYLWVQSSSQTRNRRRNREGDNSYQGLFFFFFFINIIILHLGNTYCRIKRSKTLWRDVQVVGRNELRHWGKLEVRQNYL